MSLSGEGTDLSYSPKGEMSESENHSLGFEIRFVEKALGEGLFATSKIEARIIQFYINTIDKVIFSCFPYCSDLFSNFDKNLCSYCYRDTASIECTICHSVHYCSETCMNMNAYLFGNLSTLVTFIQNFMLYIAYLFELPFY